MTSQHLQILSSLLLFISVIKFLLNNLLAMFSLFGFSRISQTFKTFNHRQNFCYDHMTSQHLQILSSVLFFILVIKFLLNILPAMFSPFGFLRKSQTFVFVCRGGVQLCRRITVSIKRLYLFITRSFLQSNTSFLLKWEQLF